MTPEQVSAFNASVGGFFTPTELRFVVAAMIMTLAVTWLAWLSVSGYAGVAHRAMSFGTLIALILRGALVLALFGYFIR